MSEIVEPAGTHAAHTPVIPVSAGIPPILRWSFVAGIVLVLIILGMVISQSFYGHVWPSTDAQKIRLSPTGTGPTPAGEPIGQ